MIKEAFYFGCLGEVGHFLWSGAPRSTLCPGEWGVPWRIGLMDAGLLENGKIPDVYDGRVFWTMAKDLKADRENAAWFAFYWWDRSVDTRGASNSGLYVRGFDRGRHVDAFQYGCDVWHIVVNRQKHPLNLQINWRTAPLQTELR